MESKNSMSNRSSLSFSSTNPMAESTQINTINLQNRFPWGGTVISPKRRNFSTSVTNGNTYVNRTKGTLSPISSKIDPRVFTDVQSKGLSSRIVKYHEHSARFNRSLSASSLYNKPGQFPVVHLKKTVIPYRANRNHNLSMVRIAPPEKSAFQGSTLSSILRSGSVVGISGGLQKCGDVLSNENRPILHPPATENEMVPTRSVLEVLKEISRKRINSDELDSNDSIKKHCKDSESDVQQSQQTPSSSKLLQQAIAPQNISITKRQRENHSSPTSNQRSSPDQKVKKRLCRNNDITSSLSSSIMLMITTKRKNDEISNESPDSFRQPKQRCNDVINKEDKLNLSQSYQNDPITPLPPTPAASESSIPEMIELNQKLPAPIINNKKKSSNRPKVTLFNRDYDSSEIRHDIDETPTSTIQFVKPKKNGSICSTKSSIQNAQKSKLALMLSGLKGELNDEKDDETDNKKISSEATKEKTSQVSEVAITTSEIEAKITFGTTTTAVTTTITSPIVTSKLSSTLHNNTSEYILQSSNVDRSVPPASAPLLGSGDVEVKSTPNTVSVAPVSTTSQVEKESKTPSTIGGFKFEPSIKSSLVSAKPVSLPMLPTLSTGVTNTTSASSLVKTLNETPLVGNATMLQNASITNFVATSSPTTHGFSFNVQPSVTVKTTSSIVPSFTFEAKETTTTIASTSLSTMPTFNSYTKKSTESVGTSLASTSQNLFQNTSTFGSISTSSSLAPISTSCFVGSLSNQSSTSFVNTSVLSKPITSVFGSGFDTINKASDLGVTPLDNNKNNLHSPKFGSSFENTFANTTKSQPQIGFNNIIPTVVDITKTVFKTPSSSNTFQFGSNAGELTSVNSGHGDSNTVSGLTTKGGFSFPILPKTSTVSPASTTFVFSGANTMITPLSTENKFSSSTIQPIVNQGFGDAPLGTQPKETKSIFGGSSVQSQANYSIFGQTNTQPQNTFKQTFGTISSNITPTTTAFVFGTSQKTTAQNNFSFNAPLNSSGNTSVNSPVLNSSQLQNAANNSNNVFGSVVAPNNSTNFKFGGNSSTSTSKPAIFGSISAAISNAKQETNNKNLFGGFNSAASNSNVSLAVSSGTSSNNVFGSSFGLSAKSPFDTASSNKVFSFGSGGTSNNTVNNSFIFNGSNQSKPDSTLHSFGQTLNSPSVATLPNLFLVNNVQQVANNATNERPIKKATRRLNK